MLGLSQSLGRTRGVNAPQPLPTVFQRLADERGVSFRRGQLSMIAAASGAGKTLFAQWLAIHAQVPSLFFSADTDETTVAERGAAMLTQHPQESIRACNPEQLAGYAEVLYQRTRHIVFDFEVDHTNETIEESVNAFGLVFGEWPSLIVFDVLMSYQPGAGDWQAMNDFILNCKSIASRTQAHVILLHHTTGQYADKTEAPPKSALMNKNDQLLSLIITMGRDGDRWNLAVVKNRNGRSDPRAESPLQYGVDFSLCTISESPVKSFYDQIGS